MTQAQETRVLLFDLFRIIAVAMVISSHIMITMGYPVSQWNQISLDIGNFSWKTWGELGVTLFLIISGLSLEYANGKRKMNFGPFYMKRIIRIYPIYYMSLFIGFSMNIAFALRANIYYGKPLTLLSGFNHWDFILTLSGLNAFAGKWGGTLVWSSWFVGLIMTLYLVYPVISWGMKQYPWLCIILLFLASIISRHITGQSDILSGRQLEWFPLNRIFEFGLGVFLIRVIKKDAFLGFNQILQRFPYLTFLSSLSFPLFLIHDPFRRFIYLGQQDTNSLLKGVPVFLILAFLFSICALMLDRKIERHLMRIFHLEPAL